MVDFLLFYYIFSSERAILFTLALGEGNYPHFVRYVAYVV